MQDLISPTGDWTRAPAFGAWSLNHWTAREVLLLDYLTAHHFIHKIIEGFTSQRNFTYKLLDCFL